MTGKHLENTDFILFIYPVYLLCMCIHCNIFKNVDGLYIIIIYNVHFDGLYVVINN